MEVRFLASLFAMTVAVGGPVACGGDDESTPNDDGTRVDVGERPGGADAVAEEVDAQVDAGELPDEADAVPGDDVDEPAVDVAFDAAVPEDVDEPAVDVEEVDRDVGDARMDVADTGMDVAEPRGLDVANGDQPGADVVDVGPDAADAPVDTGTISSRAGLVGIFMAVGNPDLVRGAGADVQEVRRLIRQSVRWVSTADEPSVLYLRGDHVEPEDMLDPDDPIVADWRTVTRTLRDTFAEVDIMEAPAAEQFDPDLVAGYDVIWFAVPYSSDIQPRTVEILTDHYRDGVGLVLQGEDSIPRHFDDLTRVEATRRFRRNPCNRQLGPDLGNAYSIQFTDQPNPATEGLRSERFEYAGPIREVQRTFTGEQVLAYANFTVDEGCSYEIPAVIGIGRNGRVGGSD